MSHCLGIYDKLCRGAIISAFCLHTIFTMQKSSPNVGLFAHAIYKINSGIYNTTLLIGIGNEKKIEFTEWIFVILHECNLDNYVEKS